MTEAAAAPAVYEPCVVSFIDILGFREFLRRDASDVRRAILRLRDATRPDEPFPIGPDGDPRLMAHAYSESVSDAIVRVCPFDTTHKQGALIWEILSLLHAQIDLVNAGILIRGGVSVGEAHVGLHGEGPIFGPAMVRAYEIESKEAIYPRVVIDNAALELHRTDARLRDQNSSLEVELRWVKRLLAVGEDGTHFIDYLGAEDEFDDFGSYLGFLRRHAEMIRAGRAGAQGSVLRKYEWLARYHNRRAKILRSRGKWDEAKADFEFEFKVTPQAYFASIAV